MEGKASLAFPVVITAMIVFVVSGGVDVLQYRAGGMNL
jgi:hypothetical protein